MQYRIFLIFFCLFTLSSCQLFSGDPVKSFEIKKDTIPLELPPTSFQDSLDLEEKYINNFRLDGMMEIGETSRYLLEKEKLMAAYRSGDRSLNLLRAYIYLVSLEGDFSMRNTLETELCQLFPAVCQHSFVNVEVTGNIRDSAGNTISGARVEVLGTTHFAITGDDGNYSLKFDSSSPSILRLRASFESSMIDVAKLSINDSLRQSKSSQKFERNFTIQTPLSIYQIDVGKKTIVGEGGSVNSRGFLITNPYSRYSIPFDAIVQNGKPYRGKLTASVFEFDRTNDSGTLLNSDVFDTVEGFLTSTLITFGMPFVVLKSESGEYLDITSANPMEIATTMRVRDDIMKTSTFDILYKMAYDESRRNPGKYPINNRWLFDNGNLRLIPGFWVYDRSKGYWNNVGFRYVTTNPDAPYNIEAPFYTILAQ